MKLVGTPHKRESASPFLIRQTEKDLENVAQNQILSMNDRVGELRTPTIAASVIYMEGNKELAPDGSENE